MGSNPPVTVVATTCFFPGDTGLRWKVAGYARPLDIEEMVDELAFFNYRMGGLGV